MSSRPPRRLTRSELVRLGGTAALALLLAGCGRGGGTAASVPLGALEPDPEGVLDLPPGCSYRVLSARGSLLRGGLPCPGSHDGMGAFAGPDGTTVLVRNHELWAEKEAPLPGKRPFDASESGCTTAVVLDPDLRQLDAYLTSSGTHTNCGGGVTPWGTWLTCEETVAEGHGYVFEVQWDDPESELSRQPILAMGRFSHEAVAFDAERRLFYLTEDDHSDDPVSFLYRYLPDDPSPAPGALHAGGRLEALAVEDGERASWVAVEPGAAHEAAAGGGARAFRRLEGCAFAAGALWFADTLGGEKGRGGIYRYVPGEERLEVVVESRSEDELEGPDNVGASSRGEVVVAEDGDGENRLLGVSVTGETTLLARAPSDEFAGPCFSPDGATLFLNLYEAGMTLAVRGPFGQRLS